MLGKARVKQLDKALVDRVMKSSSGSKKAGYASASSAKPELLSQLGRGKKADVVPASSGKGILGAIKRTSVATAKSDKEEKESIPKALRELLKKRGFKLFKKGGAVSKRKKS